MRTEVPEVVNLTEDRYDDDDVSVLYATPILRRKGTNTNNPISVEIYTEEKDLQLAIMASLYPNSRGSISSRRRAKKIIDLSQNYLYYDDVHVVDSYPKTTKKFFKGDSSNSKSKTDAEIGTSVDLTFICDICVDEKPKTALFRILGCTHSYCSDCVAKYVASKLQENITNMSCPVSGCRGRLELENCRSILPSQVFDRWGDALCEGLILAAERFYCPFKDCSSLLINDRNTDSEVITQSECPDCRRLFCAECKVPWHSEISCAEFKKLNEDERAAEDIMLMNLAKKNKWMRCPKCRFYVEKSEGCLFMACRCKYSFCYGCGAHMKEHYCRICKR